MSTQDAGPRDPETADSLETATSSTTPFFSPPASPQLRYQEFPEDLRAPWGWVDLLFFVLVTFGLYIGLAVILVIGFIASGRSPQSLKNSPVMMAELTLLITVAVSAAQLGYLYLRTRMDSSVPFWKALGWRSFSSLGLRSVTISTYCIFGGAVFALLISLASAALGQKNGLPIETFFQDRRTALMLMLLGVLVAPLVEETIFRGFIYPVMARSLGVAGGVLVTGVLFGLVHAAQLWGAWAQIGLLMLVGVMFTAARAASRTVLASYLLHVTYNSFLFGYFLIVTHGLTRLPVTPR